VLHRQALVDRCCLLQRLLQGRQLHASAPPPQVCCFQQQAHPLLLLLLLHHPPHFAAAAAVDAADPASQLRQRVGQLQLPALLLTRAARQ
jgi:hypothetical protein